jgi:hypothetical protein
MSSDQRTSLAEFSRLYLQPQPQNVVTTDNGGDLSTPVGPLQPQENSFAVQVFLGMSKKLPTWTASQG